MSKTILIITAFVLCSGCSRDQVADFHEQIVSVQVESGLGGVVEVSPLTILALETARKNEMVDGELILRGRSTANLQCQFLVKFTGMRPDLFEFIRQYNDAVVARFDTGASMTQILFKSDNRVVVNISRVPVSPPPPSPK
jgi:hypothetical protein